MNISIQLYGFLILTVLGFVLPILTILLSIFPEGVKSLADKYENEKKHADDNIINEIKKKESGEDLDYSALESTLESLKKKKQEAEDKLTYLRPPTLVVRISVPFVAAFVGVLIALQNLPLLVISVSLVLSVLSFIYGTFALWSSLHVLMEVSEIVNQAKKNTEEKTIELLSILVEKSGDSLFIKKEEMSVLFNSKYLTEASTFEFSVNRRYEIPIAIYNRSDKMAKNVEVGFVFPKDFLIEDTTNLSIYTDEARQIIRFKAEILQAREQLNLEKMNVTFLKSGDYKKIEVFIKGENIKYNRFAIAIKVID